MLISVYNPQGKTVGVSTVTSLLGMGLAREKRRSLILHTDKSGEPLKRMFGFDKIGEDKRLVNYYQVMNLIIKGSQNIEELKTYAYKVMDEYLSLFTINENEISQSANFSEDLEGFFLKVRDSNAYDFFLVDVSNKERNESTEFILKNSDAVVIVVDQNLNAIRDMVHSQEFTRTIRILGENKVELIVVANKFDQEVGNDAIIAKELGIKAKILKIDYNPYIMKDANFGQIYKNLYKYLAKKDGRLLTLDTDMRKLALRVSKIKFNKARR